MNLRVSVTNSGMTEPNDQVEGRSLDVTSVVFNVVSNAIDELGHDVYDGFSEPIDFHRTAQSLPDQSRWFTSESDETDDDESDDVSSVALDEYAVCVSFFLPRILS